MPIYEFDCESCQHSFEELVANPQAVEEVLCPKCDSGNITKKISLFASKSNTASSNSIATQACTTST